MDIFIYSVGHLVRHSKIFLSDILKKMSDFATGLMNFDSTGMCHDLDQGHISKVKVKLRTQLKFLSGP